MLPWTREYLSLHANGDERNCWEILFPAHCLISGLTCIQVSGGEKAEFRLKLFNSRRPCSGSSQSSGGANDPDGYYEGDPLLYEAIPEQVSDPDRPGVLEYYPPVDRSFQNADGDGPSTREHRAYIEITPLSSGQFTYDLSVKCQIGSSG